jgi:galactokinase
MFSDKEFGVRALMDDLEKGFSETYGRAPEVLTRAPGRLEILGNHTDYNEGVVLSVAVDRYTGVAAVARDDTICRIKDLRDQSTREFDLKKLDNPEKGDWANYIKGVAKELQNQGFTLKGFDACLLSNIPLSSGMSSSAALEMAAVYAMVVLNDLDIDPKERAKVGQRCENDYVGAPTGLLDQFSSVMGKKDSLVFSDFRSLEVSNVPIPQGTAFVVANSMVKHDLTEEYKERRECCEAAAEWFHDRSPAISALRDVSLKMLEEHSDELPVQALKRARHVVGENERVYTGMNALENNDIAAFGKLMLQSHESSRVNFENSCPELDQLIETAESLPGHLGGRLSGGGFGGITVHLVKAQEAEQFCKRLTAAYKNLTGTDPQTMICMADEGAEANML